METTEVLQIVNREMENLLHITNVKNESTICHWERLTSALQEYILTLVPIDDVIRLQLVKKYWRSLIRAPQFMSFYDKTNSRSPWFFLQCVDTIDFSNDRTLAFNPDQDKWYVIQQSHPPPLYSLRIATSADGMMYITCDGGELCYSRNLFQPWISTARLSRKRNFPIVSMWKPDREGPNNSAYKLVAVGGLLWPEYLFVDTDDDHELAVEVYDSISNEWTVKESLPREFFRLSSRDVMRGVIWNNKLFVTNIFRKFSTFYLKAETWSPLMGLSVEVTYPHLVVWSGMLILTGIQYHLQESLFHYHPVKYPFFKLWHIDDRVIVNHTMHCREMTTMPSELLSFITKGDGRRLECRADNSHLYVYNTFPKDDGSYPIVACNLC